MSEIVSFENLSSSEVLNVETQLPNYFAGSRKWVNTSAKPLSNSNAPSPHSFRQRFGKPFRVMSYNLLADRAVTLGEYKLVPPAYLSPSYRNPRIRDEILALAPHLIGCQEVQDSEYWSDALSNYAMYYKSNGICPDCRVANSSSEEEPALYANYGNAIFWDPSRFLCVAQAYTLLSAHDPLRAGEIPRTQTALCALLLERSSLNLNIDSSELADHNEEIPDISNAVFYCAVNSHILYNPRSGDVKFRQAQTLMHFTHEWASHLVSQGSSFLAQLVLLATRTLANPSSSTTINSFLTSFTSLHYFFDVRPSIESEKDNLAYHRSLYLKNIPIWEAIPRTSLCIGTKMKLATESGRCPLMQHVSETRDKPPHIFFIFMMDGNSTPQSPLQRYLISGELSLASLEKASFDGLKMAHETTSYLNSQIKAYLDRNIDNIEITPDKVLPDTIQHNLQFEALRVSTPPATRSIPWKPAYWVWPWGEPCEIEGVVFRTSLPALKPQMPIPLVPSSQSKCIIESEDSSSVFTKVKAQANLKLPSVPLISADKPALSNGDSQVKLDINIQVQGKEDINSEKSPLSLLISLSDSPSLDTPSVPLSPRSLLRQQNKKLKAEEKLRKALAREARGIAKPAINSERPKISPTFLPLDQIISTEGKENVKANCLVSKNETSSYPQVLLKTVERKGEEKDLFVPFLFPETIIRDPHTLLPVSITPHPFVNSTGFDGVKTMPEEKALALEELNSSAIPDSTSHGLLSAYSHPFVPSSFRFTSCQSRGKAWVDHILYTAQSEFATPFVDEKRETDSKEYAVSFPHLSLQRVLDLPNELVLSHPQFCLPNDVQGSDHYPLVAEFMLTY